MAVHAAVGQEAQDVQRAALCKRVVHGLDVGRVFKEAAIVDGVRYPGQVLVHHAARANVGVADLGVAHLSLWQTHVQAGGGQLGVRAAGQEFVHDGGLGRPDRVTCVLGADAVTVEYQQCCGSYFIIHGSSSAVPEMMRAKSLGLSEAPPMRPPSISGWARSSSQFLSFMLPP